MGWFWPCKVWKTYHKWDEGLHCVCVSLGPQPTWSAHASLGIPGYSWFLLSHHLPNLPTDLCNSHPGILTSSTSSPVGFSPSLAHTDEWHAEPLTSMSTQSVWFSTPIPNLLPPQAFPVQITAPPTFWWLQSKVLKLSLTLFFNTSHSTLQKLFFSYYREKKIDKLKILQYSRKSCLLWIFWSYILPSSPSLPLFLRH